MTKDEQLKARLIEDIASLELQLAQLYDDLTEDEYAKASAPRPHQELIQRRDGLRDKITEAWAVIDER